MLMLKRNNKIIVVRVNDRGPFVDDRVIDLSYAAAKDLDMIRDGTASVRLVAPRIVIQSDVVRSNRPHSASQHLAAKRYAHVPRWSRHVFQYFP